MKTTSWPHLRTCCLAFALAAFASTVSAAQSGSDADSIATKDGPLTVHPIYHATLALQWNGKTILVDPVGGAKRLEPFKRPDLVLITHTHGDHFNNETLSEVVGPETKLVGPTAVVEQLPTDLRNRAKVLGNGQEGEILGIRVQAVPAYNLTTNRLKFHAKGAGNSFVLTLGGKRVYISGDTEDTPELLALKEIDLAFVCINLPYTMDVDQAARAVRSFKPRVVYPYHCRGSDIAKFTQLVGTDAGVDVRVRDWYPKP